MSKFKAEYAFLTRPQLAAANDILRLEQAVVAALTAAADKVRGDEQLLGAVLGYRGRFMRHADAQLQLLFDDLSQTMDSSGPLTGRVMGEHADMFPVILALSVLPWTIGYYQAQGIAREVLVDTMSDLAIWIKRYYAEHGVWGLDNLRWLLRHLSGRLFRIGRLQYTASRFQHAILAFRHIGGGQIAVLSEPGVDYRADGQREGTNDRFDGERKWTSAFAETDDAYIGNPIHPLGYAARETVRLPKDRWQVALRRGDPVLELHIAEGGKLSPALCRQSMRDAADFYGVHYPDEPFHAFVCTTWLLDSQFQRILPPSANIVQFQRLFHLHPVLSHEGETYHRVFGTSAIDPNTAPRDTALRRAILDYASAGHKLHGAAGFLLATDVLQGIAAQ